MNFRAGGEWLCFGFDETGRLRQRAYQFGQLPDVARDFRDSCASEYNGAFDPQAVLFTVPRVFPGDLIKTIDSALAVKLPGNLCRLLPAEFRPYWCETRSFGSQIK